MKSFGADFAFANVFVAVDAASERNLRVVGMEDRNAMKSDR